MCGHLDDVKVCDSCGTYRLCGGGGSIMSVQN